MQFQKKNPYTPQGRSLETSRGGGGENHKPKILEAKYEAKLGFPEGRDVKQKNLSGGGVWIVSATVQWVAVMEKYVAECHGTWSKHSYLLNLLFYKFCHEGEPDISHPVQTTQNENN